jgi:anti-sigma factor RsiW
VQAFFDAELDPLSADSIERHVEHCAECRALLGDLHEVRGKLRRDLEFARAPAALRSRIDAALDAAAADRLASTQPRAQRADPVRRSFWLGALGGFGGAAVAAVLAFFVLLPARPDALLEELVNAHVRSLMPDHLIDVASTDRHTVKPWFAGHADVSPVVADFAAQGYTLVGGRTDYFDGQRAAVIVYRHGAHTINVFSWAASGSPPAQGVTRNGYRLEFWRSGNLEYCAVSDTGRDELHALVQLLQSLE